MRKGKWTFVALPMALAMAMTGCGNVAKTEETDSTASQVAAESLAVEGQSTVTESQSSAETQEEDLSTGSPWIDSEVIGAMTEDMEFDIKDDFAAAINKDWFLQAEIPEGYSSTGTSYEVSRLTEQEKADIITGDNPDNDTTLAQIQSLYELYMDWDARNEAGVTPLKPVLEKLDAIQSMQDMNEFLKLDGSERAYLTGPFGFVVSLDKEDTSLYSITLGAPDLSLEDSSYYDDSDYSNMYKENKMELAKKILGKVGYSQERIEEIINNGMAYETLAASYITSNNDEDAKLEGLNDDRLLTRDEWEQWQEEVNLPVIDCMLASGIDDSAFTSAHMGDLNYTDQLKNIYTEENIPGIRDAMILRYVLNNAGNLDKECYEWNIETDNANYGLSAMPSDSQSAVSYVNSEMNWQLSKIFCERYFTDEDKARIYQICEDIVDEYKKMIQEEDWLSEETISFACEKLDNMEIFSLYPDEDQWPDYSGLSFKSKEEGGSLFEANSALNDYDMQTKYAKLGTRRDRTKWATTNPPAEVNCMYNVESNSFAIFAAYAQGGFYSSDMSDEELYAKLGTTIGHEISHAFDANGSKFDKNGNQGNWWTDEDAEAFDSRMQKLSDFYDTIKPWEGQQISGQLVKNEACPDITGMKVILRLVKSMPDFDYDEFFRAYANLWRAKYDKSYEEACIMDTHPLKYLRINVTLSQFDEFQETYDIKEGDGMYVAPEDRIVVW